MDIESDPMFQQWNEKYENLRKNREGIEKKLGKNSITPDKRASLEWHLKNIKRIIGQHLNENPIV